MTEKINKIWTYLGIMMLLSVAFAAIVGLLYRFFDVIRNYVPVIAVMACLSGLIASILITLKHPASHRKKSWLILAGNYFVFAISMPLFRMGWPLLCLWLFFAMIVLFVVNSHFARCFSTLLLFNANTVFVTSMSATFSALLWACFVSNDWGTLLIGMIGGYAFVVLGFLFSLISMLFVKSRFFTPEGQR